MGMLPPRGGGGGNERSNGGNWPVISADGSGGTPVGRGGGAWCCGGDEASVLRRLATTSIGDTRRRTPSPLVRPAAAAAALPAPGDGEAATGEAVGPSSGCTSSEGDGEEASSSRWLLPPPALGEASRSQLAATTDCIFEARLRRYPPAEAESPSSPSAAATRPLRPAVACGEGPEEDRAGAKAAGGLAGGPGGLGGGCRPNPLGVVAWVLHCCGPPPARSRAAKFCTALVVCGWSSPKVAVHASTTARSSASA